MTTMLYVGTHGPDDPTRATFPFHMANGALEAGYKAKILLVGDAALLMKESIAGAIQGVAVPRLSDLMQKVVAAGAEVHV
ncbi:MAG: DsrE family protein [Chloroflexi bacterium]|nr:DsrE family protein [Chloroflexota bacterium]